MARWKVSVALAAVVGAVGFDQALAAASCDVLGKPLAPALRSSFATSVFVVTTLLVLISIAFEHGEHWLLHKPSKVTRPVVRSMFAELTALGFIGVTLFVIESTSFVSDISNLVFGVKGELAHIIHEVHMALFLVMVLFLFFVLTMMVIAMRQQTTWADYELACLNRPGLLAGYSHYLHERSKMSSFSKGIRWIFGIRDKAYERIVYNGLRSRFITSDHSAATAHHKHKLKQVDESGAVAIVLDEDNSALYRKKLVVYAFRTRDPVKFNKHWGSSSGEGGDYVIVGVDDDLYVCPKQVFEDSYKPVKGEANKYRKTGRMFARRMPHEFKVRTSTGLQRGPQGSYLVQDERTGEQYSVSSVEFADNYELVDQDEITSGESHKDLPKDFNFGSYLTSRLGESLAEIVTVDWITWVVLEIVVGVLWIAEIVDHKYLYPIADHTLAFLWVASALYMSYHLNWIRDQLTPSSLLRGNPFGSGSDEKKVVPLALAIAQSRRDLKIDATDVDSPRDNGLPSSFAVSNNGVAYDEEKATPAKGQLTRANTIAANGTSVRFTDDEGHQLVISDHILTGVGEENEPAFLSNPVAKKPGCCVRRSTHMNNRHEQLFLFGSLGPGFITHYIRCTILFMSLYLSVNTLMLVKGDCGSGADISVCLTRLILVLIPPVTVVTLLPRIITIYVEVSNVEMMRKQKQVNEVLRKQRTLKSMRALRLLSALRSYTTRTADRDPNEPVHSIAGAAVRVYGEPGSARYIKRRHELKEAFAVFDRENTGHVRSENIQSLFQLLGLADTAESAAASILQELDADGHGAVEFNEFFDWNAAQEEFIDPETLTRDIFNIIDRDKSQDITATELRDTLSSLGAVMTPEDIMHIVREADHNNTGTISYHEFQHLMRNSMKGEKYI